jgi:hypothetical protein
MTQKSDLAKLDKNFAPVEAANDLKWYDIRDLGLEGRICAVNPVRLTACRAKTIF